MKDIVNKALQGWAKGKRELRMALRSWAWVTGYASDLLSENISPELDKLHTPPTPPQLGGGMKLEWRHPTRVAGIGMRGGQKLLL